MEDSTSFFNSPKQSDYSHIELLSARRCVKFTYIECRELTHGGAGEMAVFCGKCKERKGSGEYEGYVGQFSPL